MKKVVLASLLACAAIAVGLPSTSAAQTAAPSPVAGAAAAPCQMPDAEFKPYTDALAQTNPQAKAAAIEAYLAAFPTSACPDTKEFTLEQLAIAYFYANNIPKALDTADRVLQLNPNNLYALYIEAQEHSAQTGALTDPAAQAQQQAGMDAAAGFAQRALAAPKPASMSDDNFKKLQASLFPTLYSVIGNDAYLKKDAANAIEAFKKELALVPPDQTKTPGTVLQDIDFLGYMYSQLTPPDYLSCAFYVSRASAYAPEPYKTAFSKTAKSCYRHYHGADDGYDAVLAAATANLNPPDGFQASVKPAPTPPEIIAGVISSTPDLAALAPVDREFIIQNGTPDQVAKVWDAIKGKSVTYPGALVIASTPTQVQVAIGDDAVAAKTADFTFNLTPPDPVPDLKANATPVQKAAYKKAVDAAQKQADAVTAATAVGQTVTLEGTYDSYTAKPMMFTMSDASVVLPTAAKTPVKSPARAPVRKPGVATAK